MRIQSLVVLCLSVLLLSGPLIICSNVLTINSSPNTEEASPNWSPDGQQLVFECYLDGPTEGFGDEALQHYYTDASICTIDYDGRNKTRLTKNSGADRYPIWSPDGTQIAFTRHDGIYLINSDGSNQRQLVKITHQSPEEIGKAVWSSDGNTLLFSACLEAALERDIYLADVKTGDLTNLTSNNEMHDTHPAWVLNDQNIVFKSSPSLISGTCYSGLNSSEQLRVIDIKDDTERILFDNQTVFPFIAVSSTGEIAFISNLVSNTSEEYLKSVDDAYLYIINLKLNEPIEMSEANRLASWSPNGKYLAYEHCRFRIIDVETKEVYELPKIGDHIFIDNVESWSPDNSQIAVTISDYYPNSFHGERHIYIIDWQNGSARPLVKK